MPEEQMESTGYEDRLHLLDDDEGYEVKNVSMMVDEFWKPKEEDIGKVRKGIFLELRRFEKQVKRKNPQTGDLEDATDIWYEYVFQGMDKKIYAVSQSKFLEQRLEDVKEGDGVSLQYLGKRKGQGGFAYHTWEVKIKAFDKPTAQKQKREFVDDPESRQFVDELVDELLDRGISAQDITQELLIGRVKELAKTGTIDNTVKNKIISFLETRG